MVLNYIPLSAKSNVQVNSTSKIPTSALVYAMNQNLGDPSSASAVTGADAFSKIGQLSSELTKQGTLTATSSSGGNIITNIPTTTAVINAVNADYTITLGMYNNKWVFCVRSPQGLTPVENVSVTITYYYI